MVRKSFIKELNGLPLTIFDKIWDFICYNRVTTFFRHLGRFLKRLITWSPILWEVEDWDSHYIYELIKQQIKDLIKAHEEDTWHRPEDVQRSIKQMKICLAYLDRYQNWPNYVEYPMDDIIFVPLEDGCSRMVHINKINELKRSKIPNYEKFNYDMFWKRFLQWHQNWWT